MQLTEEKKFETLKRIFSEDIEAFAKYFFPHHLRLDTPAFHKEIFELYQSDAKRIGIAAPRGHAKSTITDLVYLSWAIVHKKVHFVLLVSDSFSQATLFLETLKAEIEENERLKAFYGELKSDTWNESEIVANGIMVKALGAGMKVRGLKYREYRPDLVLIDDLENDEMVVSKERREKLERWYNAALEPCMGKDGRMIIIGTILHYDSLLAHIQSADQYTEYVKRLYKAINGDKALWPEHLSLADLMKKKEEYTQKGQGHLFYQEFQNDPISGENRKFKMEKMRFYTEEEIEKKEMRTYITIDRAYSTQKVADFTGIIVVSVDQDNNWYVRQAARFKGNEGELIDKIFGLRAFFRPTRMGIEQKAFEYTIKPSLINEMRRRQEFFTIEELSDAQISKTYRIEGLIPRFEAGTIYLKRDQVDLMDELIQFPMSTYDDLADALAYQLQIQLPTHVPKRQAFLPQREKKKVKPNTYSMRMA